MNPINSVKAIIINNNELLLVKNVDEIGEWYSLPGGSQRFGESLTETLKRECKEEISITPIVNELICIREYINDRHPNEKRQKEIHKIEFMFSCTIENNDNVKIGNSPDTNQVGVEWISLNELQKFVTYPRNLEAIINSKIIYCGEDL